MANQPYKVSCQCGAVSFEADLDLDNTITCNCSRCQRLGAVLTLTPRGNFTLRSGERWLSEYTFNKHAIHHEFCPVCGIEPFAFGANPDGSPVVAVNVNCLEGVDPRALPSTHVDGRAL